MTVVMPMSLEANGKDVIGGAACSRKKNLEKHLRKNDYHY